MIQREDANVTDLNWVAVSPLHGAIADHASAGDAAGIRLLEMREFAAVQIMARRGHWAALAKAVKAEFGIMPPSEPRLAKGRNVDLLWSGPDQFLAISSIKNRLPHENLRQKFGSLSSISDQSDGRVLISVTGPKVRDMLAKVCSLDLHEDVFEVGTAAVTAIDHLSTNVWREADGADGHSVFKLLLLSTFAISLWQLLVDSSAEYGVTTDTATY
jgi:methylglutamate dehydrogenase subunit D